MNMETIQAIQIEKDQKNFTGAVEKFVMRIPQGGYGENQIGRDLFVSTLNVGNDSLSTCEALVNAIRYPMSF